MNNEREKAQHFPWDESIKFSAKQLWIFSRGKGQILTPFFILL
jgi:hypothetical protein